MSKPYMAFALQPKVYGCADRKEAKKNLKNLCSQIDGCMYVAEMEYPAKLVAVPEGAITGFYDEHSRMDYIAQIFREYVCLAEEDFGGRRSLLFHDPSGAH